MQHPPSVPWYHAPIFRKECKKKERRKKEGNRLFVIGALPRFGLANCIAIYSKDLTIDVTTFEMAMRRQTEKKLK